MRDDHWMDSTGVTHIDSTLIRWQSFCGLGPWDRDGAQSEAYARWRKSRPAANCLVCLAGLAGYGIWS